MRTLMTEEIQTIAGGTEGFIKSLGALESAIAQAEKLGHKTNYIKADATIEYPLFSFEGKLYADENVQKICGNPNAMPDGCQVSMVFFIE